MIRRLVLLAMLAVTLHARAQISVTDDTGNTFKAPDAGNPHRRPLAPFGGNALRSGRRGAWSAR